MFDLPYGMPVDDEIDVSDGVILPFENGSITTYLGRRSTASGHRIVRAGRVVGWIAEPAKGKVLLCGKAAKDRLETLELDQHRLIAKGLDTIRSWLSSRDCTRGIRAQC